MLNQQMCIKKQLASHFEAGLGLELCGKGLPVFAHLNGKPDANAAKFCRLTSPR